MMVLYSEFCSLKGSFYNVVMESEKREADEEGIMRAKDLGLIVMGKLLDFERQVPRNVRQLFGAEIEELEQKVSSQINRRI